jgi:hypothetical protein
VRDRHGRREEELREELIKFKGRERMVRLGRWHREGGKGPNRLRFVRSTEVTEGPVQDMPVHLHGVGSWSCQSARAFPVSTRPRLASSRKRPSWVREEEIWMEQKRRNERRSRVFMVSEREREREREIVCL